MEKFINLFFVILIVALGALIWFLLREIQRQQQPTKRRRSANRAKKRSVPPKLERKLLLMLGGDRSTAYRLVSSLRKRNPGQEKIWYWEKAMQRGLGGSPHERLHQESDR